MTWIIAIALAATLALVAAAGFARAAARARTAPQPTSAPIRAGDIGPACLACRPGWEPAHILDAAAGRTGLIIRTAGPDAARTNLIIPPDQRAMDAFARLLALEDTPPDPAALASSITGRRAGTIIAIRATQEELS